MNKLLFLFLLPLSFYAQENSSDLNLLGKYMSGSFHSALQAQSDTNYFNIKLDMKPIWKENTNGIWLYVEQAINKKDAKPYRQRVYHLEQLGETQFRSTIYKIDSAHQFIGYHLSERSDLTKSEIKVLEGCAILLTFNGTTFTGKTKKGKCLNSWGKAAYATSEVTVHSNKLVSWDRGWNNKDEYVWGAEKAGYQFIKQ